MLAAVYFRDEYELHDSIIKVLLSFADIWSI